MGHPVFFSFAADGKESAERLKAKFADELIYSYTRTGEGAAEFPEEILEEIGQCELFVIFWSVAYAEADPRRPWCRRELLTALRRFGSKSLERFIIVQVDTTPLDKPIVDPDTQALTDALLTLRERFRAFTAPPDLKGIEAAIGRELSKLPDYSLPELPRPALLGQLRQTLDAGSLQAKTPVVFVTGFAGSGRRTTIRSLMQSEYRHLTEYQIALDGADGPEDFLQLIWGEVIQKPLKDQRNFLVAAKRNPSLLKNYFEQLGPELVKRRSYVVIAKDDLTDFVDAVPHWFVDYFRYVKAAIQPLFFIVLPRAVPGNLSKALESTADLHVPSLEDDESSRLINMHIAARDPHRVGRWKEHLASILEAGANSPKLLVDIVRLAARRPTLDFLTQDAAATVARFDERVTQLVDWAWPRVREKKELLLLLDLLNSLNAAHYDTLSELFSEQAVQVGDALYELVHMGLVEHLSESTYRVPSAFRRKLNFYLVKPELRAHTDQILRRFAKTIQIGEDEWGGVSLSNSLHIKLATESPIEPRDLTFVTAGMLFKAGWHKYRKGQSGAALQLFRRSFAMVADVKDESTKLEITRFYGLAAAREASASDITNAISFLSKPGNFSPRFAQRAMSFAPFIRGLSHRLNQEFEAARNEFEDALEALPEGGAIDHQRSIVLNELVQCLLKITPTDYTRAVSLAQQSCALRGTPNSLDILLRALLAQTYEDPHLTPEQVEANRAEITRREVQLEAKCQQSDISFYVARLVERLERQEYSRVRKLGLGFGAVDLAEPIQLCAKGYANTGEHVLLTKKWDLMLRTETGRDWTQLHQEATAFLEDGSLGRTARGVASRIRILTFDLSDPVKMRQAYGELDKARANGTIPKPAATKIRTNLDLGSKLSSSRLSEVLTE